MNFLFRPVQAFRPVKKAIAVAAVFSLLAPLSTLAADKKKDPDEIGNRDVGKGVNFYSI